MSKDAGKNEAQGDTRLAGSASPGAPGGAMPAPEAVIPDPADRRRASASAGESTPAVTGVTIRGYQPVERIGNAPSYGVWLRAIQTRMDRHVLLKLLPAGQQTLQDAFSREIGALVRLDGLGTLRVIEEGTSDGVRFLVVDEASSTSFAADQRPLTDVDWQRIGATMESLFCAVGERDLVLMPIPSSALRRLPSGGIVAADLGWLVPVGAPLPSIAVVPEELRGTPAQRWMNARFLGITLRQAAATPAGAPTRSWRRKVQELEGTQLHPDDPNPLERKFFATTAMSPVRGPLPLAVVGLVALAIVGAGAWLALRGPSRVAPNVVDPDDEAGETNPVPVVDGGDSPAPDVVEFPQPADARELLETEVAEIIDSILRDDAADSLQRDPSVNLTDNESQRLSSEVIASGRFSGTRGELRARRILACAHEHREKAAWEEIGVLLRGVLEASARSQFGVAEALLDKQLTKESPTSRLAVAAMRDFVGGLDAAERSKLERELNASRDERQYNSAVGLLNAAVGSLTSAGDHWLESRRRALLDEQSRYGLQRSALTEALDRLMSEASRGEWRSALEILHGAAVTEEFSELSTQCKKFRRSVERAQALHGRLRAGLLAHESARKPRPYGSRADGERRGTIETPSDVGAFDFNLKLDGLFKSERILYRALEPETIRAVTRDGDGAAASEEEIALLLFFLGELSFGLERASALSPPPEWLQEAQAYFARWRAERLADLLREGRAAAEAEAWDAAREVYFTLRGEYSELELDAFRPEFKGWLSAYWSRDPLMAFPGAYREDSSYRSLADGAYFVVLSYDFRKKGDTAAPADDWKKVAGALAAVRDGVLHFTGSIVLRPSGTCEIFCEELEVTATLAAKAIPKNGGGNLNIVLWAFQPSPLPLGLLFGHGFRPPKVSSLWNEDRETLLPATVIGDVAILEAGRSAGMAYLRPEPDPTDRQGYTLTARSNASTSDLAIGKAVVLGGGDGTAIAAELRHGTVEIRSYNTPLQVQVVTVKGRLQDAWWRAWVESQVESELAQRP